MQIFKTEKLHRYYKLLIAGSLIFSCKGNVTEAGDSSQSLRITADTFTTHSGGSIQLTAIATLQDETTADVTKDVIWSNSPSLVGTVSEDGLFTAVNNVIGIESIQAQYQSQIATAQIEVTKRAAFLTVVPVETNIESGTVLQFTATALYQDGSLDEITGKTSWSLKPALAATISNHGLLQGNQGMAGKETVVAKFQTLEIETLVEIQPQYINRFEMVEIPAGSFVMGDNNGADDERPEHEVYIDAFEIGKYEVTNVQYVEYLNKAIAIDIIREGIGFISGHGGPTDAGLHARFSGADYEIQFITFSGTDGRGTFSVTPGYENYPMTRMTWYGAKAFCDFYGLRLPTEAEWEKACRGGMQLEYGTSDGTLSHDLANYAGTGGIDVFEGEAPVGSFPPNPFGLYDMCGNVGEWVFDIYGATFYQSSPPANPIGPGPAMPIGYLPSLTTIYRGGSWLHGAESARSASRGKFAEPHVNSDALLLSGFRVARSLP